VKNDWRKYCCTPDITPDGDTATVTFANDRKHIIRIEEADREYRVWAIIARQSIVAEQDDLQLRIWQRNHGSKLVSYRIDGKGRLIGEAWIPKAGLTEDEFRLYARTVAAECDRLEYLLTGRDID
jgi:hypothetical protein